MRRPLRAGDARRVPSPTLVVAIGYTDGLILLCRLADGAEILVRKPDDSAVSALCWEPQGARLAYGLESGGRQSSLYPTNKKEQEPS